MRETIEQFKIRKAEECRRKGKTADFTDIDMAHGSIIEAYESGYRVRLNYPEDSGEVRDGYIGITTGWKPAFILLWNRRSMGGSIVSRDAQVVKIFEARRW